MRSIDELHQPSLPSPPENLITDREDSEISIIELLTILGRNKRLLARGTLFFGILGVVTALIWPAKYTAQTAILPPQQGGSMSSLLLSQLGSLGSLASMAGGGLSLKNPNDLYVSMLKGPTVEAAMIRRFDLQKLYKAKTLSAARKSLESNCTIEAGTKDGLIRIAIEDKNPQRATEMANAYVEEYKKFSAKLAITEASQRRLFFEQQLLQAKDNLADAEENLKRTEQTTGLIQLDSQARALIESVAQIRAQVAAKEIQIRTLSSFATSDNPDLIVAQNQLAALRAQLKQLGGSEASDGDLIVPKGKVPEAGLQYLRKLRDVKYYEAIFELLAKQLEMAKLDEAKQGAIVQVVDQATVPDHKSSPKRALIILGMLFLGMIGSAAWVLFREAIATAKKNPEHAEQLHSLREAWGRKSN